MPCLAACTKLHSLAFVAAKSDGRKMLLTIQHVCANCHGHGIQTHLLISVLVPLNNMLALYIAGMFRTHRPYKCKSSQGPNVTLAAVDLGLAGLDYPTILHNFASAAISLFA